MESNKPDPGGFSIPIQLFRAPSNANFHTLDDLDDSGRPLVNRENITDDSTAGFLIQITLERAIHGQGSDPASFIGIKFRFDGINEQRRFKRVEITIRFEDVEMPLKRDPIVEQLWPDSDYTLRAMETPIDIQDTIGISSDIGGGIGGVDIAGTAKWERQTNFAKNDRAALVGAKVLRERKSGPKNAVSIKLYENATIRSGVLRQLHAGILLKRQQEGSHRFRAIFSIEATADMRYAIAMGQCRLLGKSHSTDPVTFDPTVNYYGSGDATSTDGEAPGPAMVEAYRNAVSTTILETVRRA